MLLIVIILALSYGLLTDMVWSLRRKSLLPSGKCNSMENGKRAKYTNA